MSNPELFLGRELYVGRPVRNARISLCQARNGPYHRQLNTLGGATNALDVAVPYRTEVLAVDEGVVEYVDTTHVAYSERMDLSPQQLQWVMGRTNFIVIEHAGNLRSVYAHLLQGSGCVEVDQYVQEGQVIALSGPSGWVGDIPNVHVELVRECERNTEVGIVRVNQSVPFQIDGYHGPYDHEELMAEYALLIGETRRSLQERFRVS
ncbi:MAG: M23 family metallopeptidase [Candidatus Peribacteraceae bacterium]